MEPAWTFNPFVIRLPWGRLERTPPIRSFRLPLPWVPWVSNPNILTCLPRDFFLFSLCRIFSDAQLSYFLQEQVTPGIPLKRLGKPEDVAGMVRFLALGTAADCITGHTFNVDGGSAMGA
jgi:hypothetical protein